MAGEPAAALPYAEELVELIHRLPNPHVHLQSLAMAAFALGDSDPDRALAIDAALGPARRQELYAQGMAMTEADAVDYANAAITRCLADETT